MRRFTFIVLVILLAASSSIQAQSRKEKSGKNRKDFPAPQAEGNAPTSLNPYSPQENYSPKSSKKKRSSKITYDQQRQYYERVEAVAKAREKEAKIMEKPQYSDPMYFGHKKLPKKRPPNKMKFCKECGIRH